MNAAVAYALNVSGWMRDVELAWLARTAAALPPRATWVEVGTWMGKSWSAVALSLPVPSTIIAVDTFDGGEQDNEPRKYVAEHGMVIEDFERVRMDVSTQRPGLHCVVLCLKSIAAAELVPDRSCDVVFIDGDHRTHMVLADIAAWTPKLKPGGLLCGHDGDDPMVIAALTQMQPPMQPMDSSERGSIWCRRSA